jgi:hypothetical protein
MDTPKKAAMLAALKASLGVVSTACESAGISRQTHYNWIASDEEYKQEVDALNERTVDYAESHLFKLIKNGNPAATIFYLKTKGRNRGYVERQEVDVNTTKPLSWFDEQGE